MKIIFNPIDNKENQYIPLLVTPLKEAGFEVHALDDFLSSYKHAKAIRLVHLNWFENVDDSDFFTALRSFFRKLTALTTIKLMRKPLVWTMHNRSSHENRLSFFSRALSHLLMRSADRIIIHSHDSIPLLAKQHPKFAQKAVYLPHPNFIGVYGRALPNKSLQSPLLKLLFIGAIKPYKNIELLIQLANKYAKEMSLVIAGKPVTTDYKRKLEALSKGNKQVSMHLRFIQDQEFPAFLSSADALVLPYDIKSSLNSGTVLLGFSYQKTVICPMIGTISDLRRMQQYVLPYQYETPAQHIEELEKRIVEAIQLKKDQPGLLDEWGQHLFQYVKEEHANNKIGAQLIHLYKELIKQG